MHSSVPNSCFPLLPFHVASLGIKESLTLPFLSFFLALHLDFSTSFHPNHSFMSFTYTTHTFLSCHFFPKNILSTFFPPLLIFSSVYFSLHFYFSTCNYYFFIQKTICNNIVVPACFSYTSQIRYLSKRLHFLFNPI